MLVLSRQRDESIIIGDNIILTVVDIRGDKVRLGIDAPKEIPVHRQEVYDAIQRENRRAEEQESDDDKTAAKSARSKSLSATRSKSPPTTWCPETSTPTSGACSRRWNAST